MLVRKLEQRLHFGGFLPGNLQNGVVVKMESSSSNDPRKNYAIKQKMAKFRLIFTKNGTISLTWLQQSLLKSV